MKSTKAYFTNFISNPKAAELRQRRTTAMTFLRSAAKSYVAVIPGSGLLVDRAFDEMDEIVDKHGEEANVIVFDAQDKIVEVIKAHDGDTAATARRISDILAEKTTLLFNLGVNTTGAPERVRQALAQADFDKVVTQAEDFAEQARFQTKRVFASVRGRVTGLLSEQQRNPKAWAEKTRELGSNKWSAWKQRRSPGSGEEDSNEK
ncbi:hypothetical protein FISHEDRAFT_77430 [Fistulina hepatica ATCC 64428]|uniref:Uncharacterized protein n=1 Tax=Fistulina hepatica ATCC 64428 TaxID=1128425 RepID=A0A0D7A132_9AGAR|nr:hypothetical protein FISHEDRAFT_77430 [Fistulina hepatica ATCC 64428]